MIPLEQSHIFGCVSTMFSAKRLLHAKLVSVVILIIIQAKQRNELSPMKGLGCICEAGWGTLTNTGEEGTRYKSVAAKSLHGLFLYCFSGLII